MIAEQEDSGHSLLSSLPHHSSNIVPPIPKRVIFRDLNLEEVVIGNERRQFRRALTPTSADPYNDPMTS